MGMESDGRAIGQQEKRTVFSVFQRMMIVISGPAGR